MKQVGLLILAWLGAAQFVSAAPCVPGTLASYIALGAGGCTIGSNVLANFTQGSALNGAVNIPLAGLNVFPAGGASNPGIVVTGNITAGNGQVFSALINYTIAGSTFTSDTVTLSNTTATGNGAVTDIQNFCLNGDFQAPSFASGCAAGEGSGSPLVVLGNGSATASVNATSLGITHNLEIDSGITGNASGAVIIDQFGTSGASSQNIFTSVSAGNWLPIVAPNSIAAGFGTGFTTTTSAATSLPLSTNLGGITVTITDSAGTKATAPLFMVSAGQINYLVPANLATGTATVSVSTAGSTYTGTLQIANIAPAIFTADNSGSGPPAAQVVRSSNGVNSFDPAPFAVGTSGTPATPVAINLSPSTDHLYLMLYGTGIQRHAGAVTATIGGVSVPVTYAGAQGTLAGLDQINIGPLPQSLAGQSSVNLVITVDGVTANTVTLSFQ
jgi:uncharacterized protein (TIGR03437 family)